MSADNLVSGRYHCKTEGCKETTTHKSGYCKECRSKKCEKCGKEVMLQNHDEKICKACRAGHRKKARRLYGI